MVKTWDPVRCPAVVWKRSLKQNSWLTIVTDMEVQSLLLPAFPASSVAASFLSSPQAHPLSYSSLSALCSPYFIVLLFVAIATQSLSHLFYLPSNN